MKLVLRMLIVAVVLAFVWEVGYLAAQGTDPIIGTWELNLAKSKFSPGPPPKSDIRTFETAGAGVKFTAKIIDAEGKSITGGYTASDDGRNHPLTGNPDADTVAMRRIDPLSVEFTLKKSGKIVQTATRVMSQDRKTYTLTFKGTDAKGQQVNGVMVFERR